MAVLPSAVAGVPATNKLGTKAVSRLVAAAGADAASSFVVGVAHELWQSNFLGDIRASAPRGHILGCPRLSLAPPD